MASKMAAKERDEQLKSMALGAGLMLLGGGLTGVGRGSTASIGRSMLSSNSSRSVAQGNAMKNLEALASNGDKDAAKRMLWIRRPVDNEATLNGWMDYGVQYYPEGGSQFNALVNRGGEFDAALNLQTPEQHREALDKFVTDERFPLDTAIRMGKQHERSLPEFYTNDHKLRRLVHPSSSAVSSIKVDGNKILVKFDPSGKTYTYGRGCTTYRDATEAAKELVQSQSIGQAVNPKHGWFKAKYGL